MALVYTPPPTKDVEKVIKRATKMAKDALNVEFQTQIGETDTTSMKFFVFSDAGYCYPLWGNCFGPTQEHPNFDDKDQLILVVKIMVNVLKSRVVMQIAEVWSAPPECQCGEPFRVGDEVFDDDWRCSKCGEARCQPSKHPKRKEQMMASILVFKGLNEEGAVVDGTMIFHGIERDAEGKISGFPFESETDVTGVGGRMCRLWTIYDKEAPHVIWNYPTFCDALGVVCEDKFRAAQRLIRGSAPDGYKFLSWGIHDDISEVLEKLRMQGVDIPDTAV